MNRTKAPFFPLFRDAYPKFRDAYHKSQGNNYERGMLDFSPKSVKMNRFITKSKLRKEVQVKTAELEESRNLVQQITDTIPDVLYLIDLNTLSVIYASKAVNKFGYTPETIYRMGRNVFKNLIHPDDYQKVMSVVDEMITFKDREIRENQFRGKAADGEWRTVFSRTVLFKNGMDGRPLQILGIIQDVTSRIKTESEYQKEKERNAELARINALLDLFVHAAAHDLKGPTGNLLMLTELIKQADGEKKLELLDRIEPVIRSLSRTVTSLLDVVNMEKESGKRIRHLFFKDIFDQVMADFAEEVKAINPSIILNFHTCPGVSYIESFLVSIFRNLISNSLKYKSDERRLELNISSECEGRKTVLQFTDNGIGMDLRCCDAMFRPFTRFTSKSEGSGIGLYLINNMVTRNGGKIDVRSKPGEGTTFRVELVEY